MNTDQLAGTKILVTTQVDSMYEHKFSRRGSLASSFRALNNPGISSCGANGKAKSCLQ